MNFKIFGDKIKEFRKSNNLTQKELADKLGISRTTLSYYERASIEPNIYTILKLSEIMKCSLDSLLGSTYTNPIFTQLDESYPSTTLNHDKIKFKEELETLRYIIKKTEKTFIELEMSKKRTDFIYSELEMSKKRTDRMYDEMKRAKNRFMQFDEVLSKLDLIDKNIDISDSNVIDLSKYKNEVAEEIAPYPHEKSYSSIPYVGKVSAGNPCFAYESIIETYNIDSNKLCHCKEYFILKVSGDSMNKLYIDNDLILIEKTNMVNDDDLVIASVNNDEALFKRISINPFFSQIGLKPESTNPIHEIQHFNRDEIYILGKVVGDLKDYID